MAPQEQVFVIFYSFLSDITAPKASEMVLNGRVFVSVHLLNIFDHFSSALDIFPG